MTHKAVKNECKRDSNGCSTAFKSEDQKTQTSYKHASDDKYTLALHVKLKTPEFQKEASVVFN